MTTSTNNCCEKCANGAGKYALAIAQPYCLNPRCPCHTEKHRPNTMIRQDWFDIPEKPSQVKKSATCTCSTFYMRGACEHVPAAQKRCPTNDCRLCDSWDYRGCSCACHEKLPEQSMEERFAVQFVPNIMRPPEDDDTVKLKVGKLIAFITAECAKTFVDGAIYGRREALHFMDVTIRADEIRAKERLRIVAIVEGMKRSKWEEPAIPGQQYPLQVFNFALTQVLCFIQEPKE